MEEESKKEVKKYGIKYGMASIPVGLLAMIYNTMNTLTDNVGQLNSSMAAIVAQTSRNTSDIEYQRGRYDRYHDQMESIQGSLSEIKKELQSGNRNR